MNIIFVYDVRAEDDFYYVYDAKSGTGESFSGYDDAQRYYDEHLDEYDNLVLAHGNETIAMEYGIVEFRNNNACSLISSYYSLNRKENDAFNSCYARDGAYISSDDKNVYFYLSGDFGRISRSDVILHPYEELEVSPSIYATRDNELHHLVKAQLESDHFFYSIRVSGMPEGLENDREYFSYDGHYFYDDFHAMIDDYRTSETGNAVNDTEFINYYQYLPYRSRSVYGFKELEEYMDSHFAFKGMMDSYKDVDRDGADDTISNSMLYGQIDSFYLCQDMYGTNALMLLSNAIVDSSYGRGRTCLANNSLFSNLAFDTQEEEDSLRYTDLEDSIFSYARCYVNDRYSDHRRSNYYGTAFGDRNMGIGINASLDPNYGEKCAGIYYEIDHDLGDRDLGSSAYGIIEDKDVNIYKDEGLENIRFIMSDVNELSFVILDENEASYKIQIDDSYDSLYDYEESYGYVAKDTFDATFNIENMHDYKLSGTMYSFDGGDFEGYDELRVEGDGEVYPIPEKEGYVFDGYEEENGIKVARYKKIETMSLAGEIEETELHQYPLLDKAYLEIVYDDGSKDMIKLSYDMLDGIDNDEDGQDDVIISYRGNRLDAAIGYSKKIYDLRAAIEKALKDGSDNVIRSNISKVDYPLSYNEIRELDGRLRSKNRRNYVIKGEVGRYEGFAISGLDLSIRNRSNFMAINDTYYIDIKQVAGNSLNELKSYGEAYGYELVDTINMIFTFNYENVALEGKAIVELGIDDPYGSYAIYHLAEDGRIKKCLSKRSERYVQFVIDESGDYAIYKKKAFRPYRLEDEMENLNYGNMGLDNHKVNIAFMGFMILAIICLIGIVNYYQILRRKDNAWKDYRRSLQKAGSVQEEKQKS